MWINRTALISLIISNTRAYSSASLRIYKQGIYIYIAFFEGGLLFMETVCLRLLTFYVLCGHNKKNPFKWAPDYPMCILPVISAKTWRLLSKSESLVGGASLCICCWRCTFSFVYPNATIFVTVFNYILFVLSWRTQVRLSSTQTI